MYKPGKYLVLADTLSRPYLSNVTDQTDKLDTEHIHGVDMYTMTSDMSRERIRTATDSDRGLTLLKQTMMNGWLQDKNSYPEAVKPYWLVQNDLTEYEGIVFKGQQVIVPVALRKATISGIHDGHFGIGKCTGGAKTTVYWPGYINQIRDIVESCAECQQNREANPAMPLQPHEVSSYPYQVVASDLFELDGHSYLLVVSKWPSVVKLADTRSSTMIGHLEMFCDFGIPQTSLSDNASQYGSSEYRDFAK